MSTSRTSRASVIVQSCLAVMMLLHASVSCAQLAHIAHFVAPSYPPLARQAGISGQVTLTVSIEKDGSVAGASENPTAHPLLAQEARACLGEWKFQSANRERKLAAVFYYGFSGTTREMNPRTTVKADFTGSSVRVFITTDTAPSENPRATGRK